MVYLFYRIRDWPQTVHRGSRRQRNNKSVVTIYCSSIPDTIFFKDATVPAYRSIPTDKLVELMRVKVNWYNVDYEKDDKSYWVDWSLVRKKKEFNPIELIDRWCDDESSSDERHCATEESSSDERHCATEESSSDERHCATEESSSDERHRATEESSSEEYSSEEYSTKFRIIDENNEDRPISIDVETEFDTHWDCWCKKPGAKVCGCGCDRDHDGW